MRRTKIAAALHPREALVRVDDDLEIAYQCFGDPQGEPLLLIMGLGGPLTWWPVELCEALAEEGFLVIRFDNRDTGHSTQFRGPRPGRSEFIAAFTRVPCYQPPYTLADMAGDAIALLDHLGLDAAHVFGVSMGGMIAQQMVIDHPQRVLSLVSMMSTTGNRLVGRADLRLVRAALARGGNGEQDYVDASVRLGRQLGTLTHHWEDEALEARARETWARGISGAATARHLLAVMAAPDRTRALRAVGVPTTVLHGTADRMVHPSGGRATARAIPGAQLTLIPQLGHDLSPGVHRTVVAAVRRTAALAAESRQPTGR